jgi:hypothetical protein
MPYILSGQLIPLAFGMSWKGSLSTKATLFELKSSHGSVSSEKLHRCLPTVNFHGFYEFAATDRFQGQAFGISLVKKF